MTVIENINIAYVSQDLVFSVAQMLMEQRTFDISLFLQLVVWFCHYEGIGGTVYLTGGLILLELF